jgi:RNA polymerase sigma-70 factor (ECF subfamily)
MVEPVSQTKGSAADPFAITRWSLVAAASEAQQPLTELCLHYWYPVYAQARRRGLVPERAQHLTQAFFETLVDDRLSRLHEDPPPRFRTWLQGELQQFLDRAALAPAEVAMPTLLPPLPIDLLEKRFAVDQDADEALEQGFNRRFALEVLGRAVNRLRREAQQAGRERMFARLAPYLVREPAPADYAQLAAELQSQPLALVVALKRLRQRYRELVDDELAQTVRSADDLEAERAALHTALQPHG